MPEPSEETRSERVSMTMTPTQRAALVFIAGIHPEKYEGFTTVLEDYSLNAAVDAHRRARQLVGDAA